MLHPISTERVVFLRLPQVLAEAGVSRSTLYARIAQGLWTKPVRLGTRSVGWPASEVAQVNAARLAQLPDDRVEALVKQLHASRCAADKVSQ